MEWAQTSSNRSTKHAQEAQEATQEDDHNPLYDQNFPNELFINLKRSYEERIKSLEAQIKETLNLVENDEILGTMKLNEVSDGFRQQRVQEIVEESLLAEKEVQIERLIEANAYLKAELLRSEQEKQKIKNVYQEELSKFQRTMTEFEDVMQKEAFSRHRLTEENQELAKRLEDRNRETNEVTQQRETQMNTSVQVYQNEMFDLKQEISDLKAKLSQSEYIILQKEETITELNHELDAIKDDFTKLENTYNSLVSEYKSMKDSFYKVKESKNDDDYTALKQRLYSTENELKKVNVALQHAIAEKTALLSKSEFIASQAKQIVEKEQKTNNETIESLRVRYKGKTLKHKQKIEELEAINHDLGQEVATLRGELNESKAANEKLSSQVENNIKMIKNEWEKKCHEIELGSQKAISDLTTKYQIEISQLQSEYQSLIDRKLTELQNEASIQISKSKNADADMKAQLEGRVAQLEKDYISRTKHENILTNEILNLRANHTREMRELEEKLQTEYNQRIKELVGKTKDEYENDLREVKVYKKEIEDQYLKAENENQKHKELLAKERERIQKLNADLQESDRKKKELKARLEESKANFMKLKRLYEDEQRRVIKLEQDKQEAANTLQNTVKKGTGFEQLVSMLRNEIATLTDLNVSYKQKLAETEDQLGSLNEELYQVKTDADDLEKDKIKLEQKLAEELNKGPQRVSEAVSKVKQEEEARLEQEISYRKELQTRLIELEPKYRDLETKLKASEDKIEEMSIVIERLRKSNNDFKDINLSLEEDLRIWKNENRDLFKKLEKTKHRFEEKIARIWRIFIQKSESIRNEVATMRNKWISELEISKHTSQEIMKELIRYFQGKLNFEKFKAQEEKNREIQQITDDYEDKLGKLQLTIQQEKQQDKNEFERLVEKYIRENENLRNEVDTVKRELQDTVLRVERTNQEKIDSQKRLKTSEEENDWLKKENVEKYVEFETLQKHVREELRRLKDESNRVTNEVTQQIKSKNRQELTALLREVDELKYSNLKRLKQFEGELMNCEVAHEKDLAELTDRYEKQIDKLQGEIQRREDELNSKDKERLALKKDLNDLTEKYNELQIENQEMFVKFEEKIVDLKDIMKRDNETYLDKKSQANAEIDGLRQQIKELTKEMKMKSQTIDELNTRVKDYRTDIMRYKSLLDQKHKLPERSLPETEKPSRIIDESRINESLDTLLNKPIRSSYGNTLGNTLGNGSSLNFRSPKAEQKVELNTTLPIRQSYGEKINIVDYSKIGSS